MVVYDKASWHIDGGEPVDEVMKNFNIVFQFLSENKMLSEEGESILKYGMEGSASLNSYLVTEDGRRFLDHWYDEVIQLDMNDLRRNLMIAYQKFMNSISG